jgi:hypothetical protein
MEILPFLEKMIFAELIGTFFAFHVTLTNFFAEETVTGPEPKL